MNNEFRSAWGVELYDPGIIIRLSEKDGAVFHEYNFPVNALEFKIQRDTTILHDQFPESLKIVSLFIRVDGPHLLQIRTTVEQTNPNREIWTSEYTYGIIPLTNAANFRILGQRKTKGSCDEPLRNRHTHGRPSAGIY